VAGGFKRLTDVADQLVDFFHHVAIAVYVIACHFSSAGRWATAGRPYDCVFIFQSGFTNQML
jgi:hypothetical protein